MNCLQLSLRFFLAYLIVQVRGAEVVLDDISETGYLYEKPDKSLLIPAEAETEIAVPVTEKEELGHSTETVKQEVAAGEINFGHKPEVKSLDGYLPPEEEPLNISTKENLESALEAEALKNRKRKLQIVKRKINSVKDKEKAKLRQVSNLAHRNRRPGQERQKEIKQIYNRN